MFLVSRQSDRKLGIPKTKKFSKAYSRIRLLSFLTKRSKIRAKKGSAKIKRPSVN